MTATHRQRRSWTRAVMGTQVSLHLRGHRVYTDPAVEPAVAAVFGHLRIADELFSTYRADSQVSAIRRGELAREHRHPWVTEVVALCEEARDRTDGYFNPWRLPGGFDPSGLVKGWAAENAAAHLGRLRGFDHYLNAGGDITACVRTSRAPAWRVGVEDPADPTAFLAILELRTGGLATSGSAARGAHIVDPHTGLHTSDLRSVTVSGPALLWADIFATAAFARGGNVARWVGTRAPGYEVAAIARAP